MPVSRKWGHLIFVNFFYFSSLNKLGMPLLYNHAKGSRSGSKESSGQVDGDTFRAAWGASIQYWLEHSGCSLCIYSGDAWMYYMGCYVLLQWRWSHAQGPYPRNSKLETYS
jgi:hypothetical protein